MNVLMNVLLIAINVLLILHVYTEVPWLPILVMNHFQFLFSRFFYNMCK